jgi:dTDP-4-amino-4,6-dideoxygalactose transaminase
MNTKAAMIRVPFHAAAMGEEEVQAVSEVIRSGWLTMGARTFEFERQFASYVGAPYAIAVSSCTAGLHLCLEAIGLKPGDEVLVPTTTFTATAEVVTYLNARPVLVDIDARTLNLDVVDAARKISARTRAIIPVHFGGQPCDLAQIQDLAQTHKLHVIEDAAHALPASYCGKPIGSISELTAFSFYATKTLSTGEGGMVTTSNEDYARRMQVMRLHGISRDAWNRYSAKGSWQYEVVEAGYKYNLTDMQSALGIVQLSKCDTMNQARNRIAKRYTQEFSSIDALEIPEVLPDRTTSWHLYVLRLRLDRLRTDRTRFIQELGERGVSASVHFIPLHLQPFYQKAFDYQAGDFPVAEQEYQRCLSLPLYPTMTDEEVDQVIWAVRDVVSCWSK